jgi:acylphosphatase
MFLARYGHFFRGLNRYCYKQDDFSRVIYDDKLILKSIVDSIGHKTPKPRWLINRDRALDLTTHEWKETKEIIDVVINSTLFAKLRKGAGGRGAFLIKSGNITRSDGQVMVHPRNELLSLFLNSSSNYILEDYVEQNAELAIFNPSSLNTVRVVTYIDQSGRAYVVGGFLRVGVGSHVVDNVAAGGLYCGVDIDRGCIYRQALNEEGETFTHHPITSIKFENYPIPQWGAVLRTCTDCHEGIGLPITVGWDVAISPYGPVILEGNTMWVANVFTKSNPRAAARLWSAHLDDWGKANIGFGRRENTQKLIADKRLNVMVKVEGKVQKVGYRKWITRMARRMGLSGSVENLDNGTVRVVLAGPIRRVEALLMLLTKGPKAARVDRVSLIEGYITPDDDFEFVNSPNNRTVPENVVEPIDAII